MFFNLRRSATRADAWLGSAASSARPRGRPALAADGRRTTWAATSAVPAAARAPRPRRPPQTRRPSTRVQRGRENDEGVGRVSNTRRGTAHGDERARLTFTPDPFLRGIAAADQAT